MESSDSKNRRGFTLIELLIVIAIISTLAGGIYLRMANSSARARDTRRVSDLHQVFIAQEAVTTNDGFFYTNIGLAGIPVIENIAGTKYLSAMVDPVNNAKYQYLWIDNSAICLPLNLEKGKYYCALAKLELVGDCLPGEDRYFIVNQRGQNEICYNTDYIANPPLCEVCANW